MIVHRSYFMIDRKVIALDPEIFSMVQFSCPVKINEMNNWTHPTSRKIFFD